MHDSPCNRTRRNAFKGSNSGAMYLSPGQPVHSVYESSPCVWERQLDLDLCHLFDVHFFGQICLLLWEESDSSGGGLSCTVSSVHLKISSGVSKNKDWDL